MKTSTKLQSNSNVNPSYNILSKSVLENKNFQKTINNSIIIYNNNNVDNTKTRFLNSSLVFSKIELNGEMFKKKFKETAPSHGNWQMLLNKSCNEKKSKQ